VLFGLLRSSNTFAENLLLVLVFALALLCAIIPHEVAHGYAALFNGDKTAKVAGRLSLNPRRHIDPMGLLCFVLAGIGWAKPVPVNPFNFRNFRVGNFWVSIAGVLTNFVIGLFASLMLFIIVRNGVEQFTINQVLRYISTMNLGMFTLTYFLFLCAAINIMLMLFNLLPIFPLDGFNLLRSFTKPNNKFMDFSMRYSMFLLLGFLMIMMFTGLLARVRDYIMIGFLRYWDLPLYINLPIVGGVVFIVLVAIFVPKLVAKMRAPKPPKVPSFTITDNVIHLSNEDDLK